MWHDKTVTRDYVCCLMIVASHYANAALYSRFQEAKRRKKFKFVDSQNDLTTSDLVNRIIENRLEYIRRNQEKEQKEVRLIEKMNAQLRVDGAADQVSENNNQY